MHALVTGGAGFIGSHLSRRLLSRGTAVTIIDNLRTGRRENIPTGATFIERDISIDDWTTAIPGDVDHVFHLAAQSSGEISFEDPIYDLRTNTLGTLALLQWSLAHRVKKFVFTSSMNVYGDVADEPISEASPTQPTSFYGVGKVASENYIRIFSDLGLPSTVLRLFNVYGPGQNLANMKQGMLSIYCAYVMHGDPIVVKGSTDRFRDFVFIDDVIDAMEQAIGPADLTGVFNVCTGVRTTVGEGLEQVQRAFGTTDYPVTVLGGTPRDQFGIYGDYRRLHEKTGWAPRYDLGHGLRMMVEWIRTSQPSAADAR